MQTPFPEHPLRHAVAAELHARTFDPLCAPARVVHIAYLCGERGSGRQRRWLQRLLAHFGLTPPGLEEIGQHWSADLGDLRLRWERHTEFATYTFTRCGPFADDFSDPFDCSLLAVLPPVWLRELPGEVVSAVLVALESRDMPERSLDDITALFAGNTVIGSEVAGGAGRVWSDMRIHADGYSRVLVRDQALSPAQVGRLVKRLLELNAYRAMALLGLPLAREIAAPLADADRRLATAAARLVAVDAENGPTSGSGSLTTGANAQPERALLADLSVLAAEIESITARTTSRFDASLAYSQLVRQHLEQLRQQRIQGLQTFTEFLDARLAPAIATCTAAAAREQDLAERAARLTALLRAKVEVRLQEQNRSLLNSMDRRAQLQLRLQETVEGLSVVAIGYYGVGLVAYLLKGVAEAGFPIDPVVGTATAVPLVVGAAWVGLRRVRARLMDGGGH